MRDSRREDGAIAVTYAIMIVMLISVAALATDIGNAVSRKTSTQTQSDFAAYEAAVDLTKTMRPGDAIPDSVYDLAAAAMNRNQPQRDDSDCWRTTPVTCVSATMLGKGGDTDLTNGQLRIVTLGNGKTGMEVRTPNTDVNFGLAGVMGFEDVDVQGSAVVNVFTAGPRVLPMFAVAGCDYGRETLTDPAHTPSPPDPDLQPTDNGPADLNLVKVFDSTWAEKNTVPVNATGYHLMVSANDWSYTWKIGYFRDGGAGPELVLEGAALKSTADHTTTWPAPGVGAGNLEVAIPTSVSGAEGLWYVRAWGGRDTIDHTANKWSPVGEAIPFRVGTEVLECESAHTAGNFGTVSLPRQIPYNPNDLPANIAEGLVDGLSLVVHTTPDISGLCEEGVTPGANEANTLPSLDTNCLDTDTGLPANVATEGFVTYGGGHGLLVKPTHDGCDPNGGSAERTIDLGGGPSSIYSINDDTLSCFLLPGKTLAQVTDPSYSGGPAFEVDLLSSPRFAYVPIFSVQPDSGGSNKYSIVDFRPAFITDEVVGGDATSNNGLSVSGNYITQVKVVFFNIDAIPRDSSAPVIDFLGVGAPVVRMIQ